jgi:uncharacterized protein (TIGR03118 family)
MKTTRRKFTSILALTPIASSLATFGCASADRPSANQYVQQNLVANNARYNPKFIQKDFVDAWGIAIRPKGAGGHFWVGAGGTSWQYLGDVSQSADASLRELKQDDLKAVTVEGADSLMDDSSLGKITGIAFNGAELNSNNFRVTGQVSGATVFDGSARFVFVTDSGKVTAWTDRVTNGAITRVDGPTKFVFDGSEQGSAYFGVAIKPDTWDRLWLADFGSDPQIRTLDKSWQVTPTIGFGNPFVKGALKPGDPVPFNIQVLGSRVFVMYAMSQADPSDAGSFYAAEEDALDAKAEAASGNRPDKGKLAEFKLSGALVKVYSHDGRLNAPWGVAIASEEFGLLSGKLLVGNFGGAGRICAFDMSTGKYIDDLRGKDDLPVAIEGLWGLQFGNGESLGDADALYFAAGPNDEKDGLFGSLRVPPS